MRSERDIISARTLDGLEAARARGRTGGRKKKLKAYQVERARQMYAETGEDGPPPLHGGADRR